MPVTRRQPNKLRNAILNTAQNLDAPKLDRTPTEAAIRGFLASILCGPVADTIAPRDEDALMQTAMPMTAIATNPIAKLAVRGGVADDIERALPAHGYAEHFDKSDLLDHIADTTGHEERLPFNLQDAAAGRGENEFQYDLPIAMEQLRKIMAYGDSRRQQYFAKENNISSALPEQQLLPRTGRPHVFVDSSVSEHRANDVLKKILEGMELQKEVTGTPFFGPRQLKIGDNTGLTDGFWDPIAKELMVSARAPEPRRVASHEMRHAFQSDRPLAAEKIDPNMFTTPYHGAGTDELSYANYRAHPKEVDAHAAENITEFLAASKAVRQRILPPEYLLEMARAYERNAAAGLEDRANLRILGIMNELNRPTELKNLYPPRAPKQQELPMDLEATILGLSKQVLARPLRPYTKPKM